MSGDRLYAPSLYLYSFAVKDQDKKTADQPIYQYGEELLKKIQSPAAPRADKPEVMAKNSANMLSFSYEMTPQETENRFSQKIKVGEKDYPFWGYVAGQEIDDNCSLWVNLHIPEREAGSGNLLEVPLELLMAFNEKYRLILATDNDLEVNKLLGQTLVLTLGLTPEQKIKAKTDQKYLKYLSDRALNALFSQTKIKPSFNQEGKLLGYPIFAYGLTSNVATIPHILIWFVPDRPTEQIYQTCQKEFLQLFFDRHQIVAIEVASERQADLIDQANHNLNHFLEELANIYQKTNNLDRILQLLETHLKHIPKLALYYAGLLQELETGQEAIAFSSQRSEKTLHRLESLGIKDELSLIFLSRSIAQSADNNQKNIQKNIHKIQGLQVLLNQGIISMQCLIELAKTQREQRLISQLQALAAGLGMAGIIAASFPYMFVPGQDLIIPLINLAVHPFFASVILSITMGIGAFLTMHKYLNKIK